MNRAILTFTLISNIAAFASEAPQKTLHELSLAARQSLNNLHLNYAHSRMLEDCSVTCTTFHYKFFNTYAANLNEFSEVRKDWKNLYLRHNAIAEAAYYTYKQQVKKANQIDTHTTKMYATALQLKMTIDEINKICLQ